MKNAPFACKNVAPLICNAGFNIDGTIAIGNSHLHINVLIRHPWGQIHAMYSRHCPRVHYGINHGTGYFTKSTRDGIELKSRLEITNNSCRSVYWQKNLGTKMTKKLEVNRGYASRKLKEGLLCKEEDSSKKTIFRRWNRETNTGC